MKIVHLSTRDIIGGAARSAYRLHTGLRWLGQESFMFVANRRSDDPTVMAFMPSMDFCSRLRRRLRRDRIARDFARYQSSLPPGFEPFKDDRSEHGADLVKQLPQCDVINLHWIACFVDYPVFFATVPERFSVVWTLHDMNPFTGGCHYDRGCGKFMNGCVRCPQLGSSDRIDLSSKVWERKQLVFDSIDPARLHLVAPSCWMADTVKKSTLLGKFPVTTIPYGIDTADFAPRDRHSARDVLGLPRDGKVVLFAAESVTNRRKGFALLAEVLQDLAEVPGLVLVSMGLGNPITDSSIHHLHLGFVANERWLSIIYSAADVFVIPSLQDNLPNTVLESLACGTPVVGPAVGGIPDVVRPGTTGLLVPPGDADALRDAIVRLLNDPADRQHMAGECRRIAMEEYSLELQAKRYVALYESLLAEEKRYRA
ncbi:MAG TPA: glycosyltransferase family 4 protein [Nitrospiraceae bacterium]|nr:glycosyltransferase family 4 protein [Nitrospiraceae bacterium]